MNAVSSPLTAPALQELLLSLDKALYSLTFMLERNPPKDS